VKEERNTKSQACECDAEEGELHKFGCRWEYCPFCEKQFVEGCECSYVLLGLKSRLHSPMFDHLPRDVYEKGLSQDCEDQWYKLCESKGRIPYIYSPQLCARCGALWPKFFRVQDQVWEYYTGPGLRDKLLCEECFREIRISVDRHNLRPAWLPGIVEVEEYMKAWREGDKTKLMEFEPEKFK
jgi:hypothetical protein